MIRRRWVVAALVGGFVVAIHLLGLRGLPQTWLQQPYWQSGGFAASAPSLLSAPILAAWGAWDQWRYRRADGLHSVAIRPVAQLHTSWYLPQAIVVVGLTIITFTVVAARSSGPLTGVTFAAAVGMVLAISSGAVGWGLAVGRLLPMGLAVPAALLTLYLVLALPMTMLPFSLRHVAGIHLSCCFIDAEPAPTAVLAPTLFWTVVAGTSLAAAIASTRRWVSLVSVLAVAGLLFPLLLTTVRDLDADGSQPRARAELSCSDTAPAVCLWPEHEDLRPHAEQAVATVSDTLTRLGISPPPQATEAYPAPWSITAQETADATLWNVTIGLTSTEPPPCASTQSWQMGGYQPVLSAWLAMQVGIDSATVAASIPQEAFDTARLKTGESVSEQRTWFTTNLDQLNMCGVEPHP